MFEIMFATCILVAFTSAFMLLGCELWSAKEKERKIYFFIGNTSLLIAFVCLVFEVLSQMK